MSEHFRIRRTPDGQPVTDDVVHVAKLLAGWGTVMPRPPRNPTELARALAKYHDQRYGAPSGGDAYERLEQIVAQRFCDVADPVSGPIHPLTYGPAPWRWNKTTLTYFVDPTNSGMTQADVDSTIDAAFRTWQLACPSLSFVRLGRPTDITVAFGGPELNEHFGLVSGVLAVGAKPPVGTLYLDSAENWSSGRLLPVALHEIGHVLGLSHSTDRNSVMYPFSRGATALDAETIAAIGFLYGFLPQQRLADRASMDGPALGTAAIPVWSGPSINYEEHLFMVWKGTGSDSGLYWSIFEPGGWSPQQLIPDVGSSHGPALVTYRLTGPVPKLGLLMAWKGIPGDSTIYYSINRDPMRYIGGAWSPEPWAAQEIVPGVGTSDRPALAQFGGKILMAWKGIGNDGGIYSSEFDGVNWSPQVQIHGVGTSAGPYLVSSAQFGAGANRVYMLWKGIAGDSSIYYSYRDLGDIWVGQQMVQYPDPTTAGTAMIGVGTTHGPAAIFRPGGDIIMVWKGVQGDSAIYYSRFFADAWNGQMYVEDVGTSSRPGIALFGNRIYLAWKGIPGDTNLYYTTMG